MKKKLIPVGWPRLLVIVMVSLALMLGATTATAAGKTPLITAQATGNGVVIPAGTTVVRQGANQPYTFVPERGHRLVSVVVDGQTVFAAAEGVEPPTGYVFQDVTADHSIAVVYEANPSFAVTIHHVSEQTGREILPATVAQYNEGEMVSYAPHQLSSVHGTHATMTAVGVSIASLPASGGIAMPAGNVDLTIYYGGGLGTQYATIEDSAIPLSGPEGGFSDDSAPAAPTAQAPQGQTAEGGFAEDKDPAGGVDLSAYGSNLHEEKHYWRVSFLDGLGNEMYWIYIEDGQTVTWPWDETPTREGKVFAYWWKHNDFDENGFEVQYDFATPITEDTAIFARYYDENGQVMLEDVPMDSYYSILEDRSQEPTYSVEDFGSILTDTSEPPVYSVEDFGSILADTSEQPEAVEPETPEAGDLGDLSSILGTNEEEEAGEATEPVTPSDEADSSDYSSILGTNEEEPVEPAAPEGETTEPTEPEGEPTEPVAGTDEPVEGTDTNDDSLNSILGTNEDEDEDAVPVYSVTFLDAYAQPIDVVMVDEGAQAIWAHEGPTAEGGLTFSYWKDMAGDEAAYDLSQPIVADVTLIARFLDADGNLFLPEDGEETAGEEEPAGFEDEIGAGILALPEDEEALTAEDDGTYVPEEEAGEEEALVIEPVVTLTFTHDGVDGLHYGDHVTMTAHVSGVPEGVAYTVQWQNTISGEFADVEGATELEYTFVAEEQTLSCEWRAVVTVVTE